MIITKQLKSVCTAFWKWVQLRPQNVIIAASVFLLVVLGLILFVKFVLPALLAIVFIIALFFGERITEAVTKKTILPTSLASDEVCWEVVKFYQEVFLSAREVLVEYITSPKTANEIYDPASCREAYNGVPLLKLHLLRKQKIISHVDCVFIKEALQNITNARLRDGYLSGYLWACPVAFDVPLLKIVSVEFSDMYLHIRILLTNTPMSVQAGRLSDKPTIPAMVDDTDPLFRKGGD